MRRFRDIIFHKKPKTVLATIALVALAAVSILANESILDNGIESQTLGVTTSATEQPQVLTLDNNQLSNTYTSPVFKADFGFNAIAPHWRQNLPEGKQQPIEIRVSDNGRDWTDWVELTAGQQPRPDPPRPNVIAPETPLMIEGEHFQYRITLRRDSLADPRPKITDLRFNYIDSQQSALQSLTESVRSMGAKVFAANGGPDIISRKEWDNPDPYGDKNKGTDSYWTPGYYATEQVFLHHTATSNSPSDPEAVMRAIWDYHANTLGWGDIGYNYVLDQHGNIYEGRFGGDNVRGGHVRDYNKRSMGVAVLGCFQSNSPICQELNDGNVTPPTDATMDSLSTLLSWKTTGFGINPKATHQFCDKNGSNCLDLPTIAAHRDANNTTCNGNLFYDKMDNIRQETADKNNADRWTHAAKQLSYTTAQLSGNEVEVTLKYKNQGTAIWSNSGSNRLLLKTAYPAGRSSEFQHSEWIDDSTLTTLNEASVDPGAEGSFTFKYQKPAGKFGFFLEELRLATEDNTSVESVFGNWINVYTVHPDGTLVREPGTDKVFLVENNERRPLPSRPVFTSRGYRFGHVRETTPADTGLPTGEPVKLREGTLVQGSSDAVYAIDTRDTDGTLQKRRIVSRQVFDDLGFSFNDVLDVKDSNIPSNNGNEINSADLHPDGTLISEASKDKVFLIEAGERRVIRSRQTFTSHGFDFDLVREATSDDMELPIGDSLKLRQGVLVSGSDDPIYIIEHADGSIRKRHVVSRAVFTGLDYAFGHVLDIDDSQLPSRDGEPVQ
jgi:hypothetical protein